MKVLIIGAAGFIGGHLSQKLTQMGHEVTGIDNFFHPSKNPNNVTVLKRDIRDDLSDLISQVDVVINLAAQIHVDYSIKYPQETFDINVNGLLNLLILCKKFGKKLIFASSSEIYGSHTGLISETSTLNPQSPYAVSKLAGDLLCENFKKIYNMDINVVRNFNTFGPYQNDTSYGGVIAIFTKKALKGEPLEIFGDGTQERDYMFITDAIKAYMHALDFSFPGPINFGTGKTISINELAQMIKRITNSNSEIVHVKPRPEEVQRLQADITLAKNQGFVPDTDFERDLTLYIKWYKESIYPYISDN